MKKLDMKEMLESKVTLRTKSTRLRAKRVAETHLRLIPLFIRRRFRIRMLSLTRPNLSQTLRFERLKKEIFESKAKF